MYQFYDGYYIIFAFVTLMYAICLQVSNKIIISYSTWKKKITYFLKLNQARIKRDLHIIQVADFTAESNSPFL